VLIGDVIDDVTWLWRQTMQINYSCYGPFEQMWL